MNEANPQTTDLVAKLRDWARIHASENPEDASPEQMLDWEAADEIERLRAAIKTALGFHQVTHIHAALREALK